MERDFIKIFRYAREIDTLRQILIGHNWENVEDRPVIEKIKKEVAELHDKLKEC